ncbi:MAG: hypothetical protein R3B38_00355 [Patescibacteria group bacterium]
MDTVRNSPEVTNPELISYLTEELGKEIANLDTSFASRPPSDPVMLTSISNHVNGWLYVYWQHKITGDYNNDGVVDQADITPIASNWQRVEGGANWMFAESADGDGNGIINAADLVPIARHYGESVDHYLTQYQDADGNWLTNGLTYYWDSDVVRNNGEVLSHCTSQVNYEGMEAFRVVAVDDEGIIGPASNVVTRESIRPKLLTITPDPTTIFKVGDVVEFTAQFEGVDLIEVRWDLVMDSLHNYSYGFGESSTLPSTMFSPGTYRLTLSYGNDLGREFLEYDVVVEE